MHKSATRDVVLDIEYIYDSWGIKTDILFGSEYLSFWIEDNLIL